MKREFLNNIEEWKGEEVLSVLGPTGSGKTAAVLREVRRRFTNTKAPLLVSVDAVSVYRELDIGSAKPLGDEREPFDWAGIDIASAAEKVTAADFLKATLPLIESALEARRPVVFVGGSHFYERALVQGMSPGEASDPAFQQSLESQSSEALHSRLGNFDQRWKSRLHPNDRYRLTRYLDLVERQGFDFDKLSGGEARPWKLTATIMLGVDLTPDEIRARMRARIHIMFEQGWINETRALLARYPSNTPALQSVGYREIAEALAGTILEAELEDRVLTAHMQLAKKQRTWLRGLRSRA